MSINVFLIGRCISYNRDWTFSIAELSFKMSNPFFGHLTFWCLLVQMLFVGIFNMFVGKNRMWMLVNFPYGWSIPMVAGWIPAFLGVWFQLFVGQIPVFGPRLGGKVLILPAKEKAELSTVLARLVTAGCEAGVWWLGWYGRVWKLG